MNLARCFKNRAPSGVALCLNVLAVLVFVGTVSAPAPAQTDTFIGGTGNWSVDGNWSLGQPPMPTNDCVIPGSSAVTDDTAGTCNNFSMSAGDTLTITPGYLFLSGTSMINAGSISIGDGNGLAVYGNSGNVLDLTGGGTVTLLTANTRISGERGVPTTLVNVDNTIQGQGWIGIGELTLVNQKTISANGGTLTVQPSATGLTNTGLMEAQSGSTLVLQAGVPVTYTNTGGTIKALDGSMVSAGGLTITGGTLTSVGSGVFTTSPGGGNPTLNNLTFAGNFMIPSGAAIILEGTVNNTGTIQSTGQIFVSGNATLSGKGSVLMTGSGSAMDQLTGTDTLTNRQLIHGAGTIYELPVTNEGTIKADNTSAPLYLDGTTTNTALLEASGGGTLEIFNNTTVNNKGGTIEALTGSTVILVGTVNGGTLKTSGTGTIQSQNGTLDGRVNVPSNAGMLALSNQYSLMTEGTINNTGTIAVGNDSCIEMSQPTTLTGAGKVTMTSSSCIFGSGIPFTNQSTIEGAGTIGDSNPMPIINDGTIHANQTSPLLIVPDSTGFTNNGQLIVDTGSTLDINGLFNNFSGTTLTGGTYSLTGTLGIENAKIVTNAANLTLTGPKARILNTSTSHSALRSLAVNAASGVLSLQSGQKLTAGAKFTNKGSVTVGAGSGLTVGTSYTQAAATTTVDGTLTAPALTVQAGSLLGQGAVAAAVTSNATITAGDSVSKPGILSVTGTYTQNASGVLNISISGTTVGSQYSQVAVANGASLNGTLNIKLLRGFVPTIGSTFTILSSSAVSGKFATVNGLKINSSEHFEINYAGTAVTLKVVSGPAEE